MEKILSQAEIDTLINEISSGAEKSEKIVKTEEKRRIKNYDFRRPNKFSKNHINVIKSIYQNYARILSNILSNQMRADIEMKVASVEQVIYGEFMRSVLNPTLMCIFRMEPLRGPMILEAKPQLGFQLVDLLCGGTLRNNIELREFTEIEISIIKEVMAMMINENKMAWKEFLDLEPVMDGIETNGQLNEILSFGVAVCLITFSININGEQSLINMCIPYRAFDGSLDKLHTNTYQEMDSMASVDMHRFDIEQIIGKSNVNLRVNLGEAQITVEDFMELSCGDVLQLDILAGEPMKLYVEDCEYLRVQPGLYNKKLAVQVVEYTRKDV